MDAVSYPKNGVWEFISERVVPLRLKSDAQPESSDFNVKWTPTLVTLDPDGVEHHRTVGFLAAEELMPSIVLGIAKVHYDADRFDEALGGLKEIEKDHPESDSTPEALFLKGVCLYKSTQEPSHLKYAYEKLNSKYPGSEWARRADPYKLL
ncbi:MAG: hypothetical protein V3W31_01035 [Thermodesulfobacteriota bacterium]